MTSTPSVTGKMVWERLIFEKEEKEIYIGYHLQNVKRSISIPPNENCADARRWDPGAAASTFSTRTKRTTRSDWPTDWPDQPLPVRTASTTFRCLPRKLLGSGGGRPRAMDRPTALPINRLFWSYQADAMSCSSRSRLAFSVKASSKRPSVPDLVSGLLAGESRSVAAASCARRDAIIPSF